jgi:hypothetical protein
MRSHKESHVAEVKNPHYTLKERFDRRFWKAQSMKRRDGAIPVLSKILLLMLGLFVSCVLKILRGP